MSRTVLSTSDVIEVEMAIPQGHRHLRTTLRLRDGSEVVLQEATMAALVRGYVAIKTHPARKGVRLRGQAIPPLGRKTGFAEWQLLEDETD